jgi:hypothetical protein
MTFTFLQRAAFVAFMTLLAASLNAAPCQETLSEFGLNYRKQVNGQWYQGSVSVSLPTYGSAERYNLYDSVGTPCNTGATNCRGNNYSYMIVSITSNWSISKVIDGVSVTITETDTKAYYDNKYAGYTQVNGAPIDYSQNCHGYSFGVGNWPADNEGMSILLAGTPTCYTQQYYWNVDVATTSGHSVKADGAMCSDTYTFWEIYTETTEKFRESGVYKLTGSCGQNQGEHSANIVRAHPGLSFTNNTKM